MTAYAIEIEHRETDQVFSYYHGESLLHFNVSLLGRMHKQMSKEFARITMDTGEAEYANCMNHRGIEEPKVEALTGEQLREPGYGVVFDDNGCFTIVDGHHRLVRRYRGGAREMDFFVAPQAIWTHCLVKYTEEGDERIAAGLPARVTDPGVWASTARLHDDV